MQILKSFITPRNQKVAGNAYLTGWMRNRALP